MNAYQHTDANQARQTVEESLERREAVLEAQLEHHEEVHEAAVSTVGDSYHAHVTFKYGSIPTEFRRDLNWEFVTAHATQLRPWYKRAMLGPAWSVMAVFRVPDEPHLDGPIQEGRDG